MSFCSCTNMLFCTHTSLFSFVSDDSHMNDSVGPMRYNIEHNSVGTYGPGWSISVRHQEGVNAGPPNTLVHPVDTQGKYHKFSPFYCINTSYLTDNCYTQAPAGPTKHQKKSFTSTRTGIVYSTHQVPHFLPHLLMGEDIVASFSFGADFKVNFLEIF